MPAPAGTKRVKNKRITRPFVIGSEAWPLDPSNRPDGIPENHTTGWRVYVRNVEGGADISTWLDKVSFKLFHTYTPPLRTIDNPPFEVHETGWGGFSVDVRLHFPPSAHEKPQWRSLYLQLEPYGTDAEQAAQRQAKLVRSETCDFVEFNEPTEAFFDALTTDAQWDYLDPAASGHGGPGRRGGKGKGKRGGGAFALGGAGAAAAAGGAGGAQGGQAERTVELPARPSPGNPYSAQMEADTVEVLAAKRRELDELIAGEARREEEVRERLARLREEVGADAPKAAVLAAGVKKK